MSEKTNWKELAFDTKAIHVGQDPCQWATLDVVPPITLSSTFMQTEATSFSISANTDEGFEYGRLGNPSRHVLEVALASLENGKYALSFASGISAITTLIYLLKSGDHIVTVDDVYSGAGNFFRTCATRMNIETSFVNMLDLEETEKSFKPNTTMLWFEPVTNPTLKVIDVKAICEIARKKNPNILIGVDNTFASPYFINPLDLGADIVHHSLTKYINGHSDVIMGCVMVNDLSLYERIKYLQIYIGAVPSPFDCFLVNRSLKTLSIRMQKHMTNGLKVARALESNPRVEKVIYPGLESHPQHELYKRQMRGFSGMISFYIKTNLEGTKFFLRNLKLITTAISLGGFESLIGIPGIMSHRVVPPEQRKLLGITDNFLRFSVGLEDADDLINDIDRALKIAIPTV